MADWSKLVRKHAADVLQEGEQVLTSLLTLPSGGLEQVAIAGGVAGAVGAAGAAAGMRAGGERVIREAEARQDGRTVAGTFPVGFLLITITDRRILVFDRGSAANKRPRRLAAAYPRHTIAGVESSKAFLKRNLRLHFDDGSSLDLDGGVSQPYERFAALVEGG